MFSPLAGEHSLPFENERQECDPPFVFQLEVPASYLAYAYISSKMKLSPILQNETLKEENSFHMSLILEETLPCSLCSPNIC